MFLNHFPYAKRTAQILTLASLFQSAQATTPADPEINWSYEALPTHSGKWLHSLRIHTVPGVLYKLQKSDELRDWTTLESVYGTGAEWICPLYPANQAPPHPQNASPVLPDSPSPNQKVVFVVLEKSASGHLIASWKSLVSGLPCRSELTDLILDDEWVDFHGVHLEAQTDYFFAISSRLEVASPDVSPAAPLTAEDQAMLEVFKSKVESFTAHLSDPQSGTFTLAQQPSHEAQKRFYRVAADWSVDSDQDGRFDWQEILLDGNNVFATDSDGNGVQDQAIQFGGLGGAQGPAVDPDSGLPRRVDAEEPAPLASVEQVYSRAYRYEEFRPNQPDFHEPPYAWTTDGDSELLKAAGSWGTFQSAFLAMAIPDSWQGLHEAFVQRAKTIPIESDTDFNGSYGWFFQSSRPIFRLHLDKPAPAGGYQIPLRIAKVVQTIDPSTLAPTSITNIETLEITLEVSEGKTIGASKQLITDDPEENQRISYIPGVVQLSGYNQFEYDDDITPLEEGMGVCISAAGGMTAKFTGGIYGESARDLKIYWQSRKLNGGGTLGQWQYLFRDGMNPDWYEGEFCGMKPSSPGIYQLQAVLTFPGGQMAKFPYIRMRNDRSIKNSNEETNVLLKAGQPDFFGVCPNEASLRVWDGATRWLGCKGYRKLSNWVITDPGWNFNPDTTNSSKCNLFVTHISNQAGARTPYFTRWAGFSISAPLAREDWYTEPEKNVDLDGPGWTYQGVAASPTPGMTIASPRAGADAVGSGHVGILDYDGSWINAGAKTVNKSVNLMDVSADYRPNTMRSR